MLAVQSAIAACDTLRDTVLVQKLLQSLLRMIRFVAIQQISTVWVSDLQLLKAECLSLNVVIER